MSRKRRVERKRHKDDRLVSKVSRMKPLMDEGGLFLPYCDYGCHNGRVLDIDVCESRQCCHYHKLYVTEENKIYKTKDLNNS